MRLWTHRSVHFAGITDDDDMLTRMTYVVFALCAAAIPLLAEPVQFQSGTNRTSLLELYSSEGCSSCPPAEKWLSKLKGNPLLWKETVPVAFHVDYWDYLGW